ncbi:hypothetical protein BBJ28_00014384 [Nothophytophthora sp. Chile5]|nr:hypothetical protein BBJ28_00014384 [Nothophytophthora sp. Chile5]
MERIYSAFFTSERRREPSELTAEALELHNESHQHAKDGVNAPGRPPQGFERRLDPEFPRGGGRGDGGETDAAAKRYGPARREELRRMVVKGASVKHDLQAACQAAARAFLLAYGAKAFTAVLLASRKWSSLEYGYADAARLLLRGDTLRFGAFFGSLVGVFRVTELGARAARGGQRDAINLAIAGAVSGSALLLDSPSRRSTISLYIFVRMLDVVCRHLVSIGAVPTWRYSSECLFALSNAAIMYGFVVDPSLLPQLATGGALFFEHSKRRFELMLYCFPRALDIVWQLLKRRGLVRYVQHSEVVLFCLSMALIMSSPAQHFKPTYLRILRFIFGGDII